MELGILDVPTLFVLLLLPLYFVLLDMLIKRFRTSNLNLPPGPWKLPLIGSLHLVLNQLPHRAFHRLAQRHGPIMLVQLGLVDTLIVSSPEVATEIMGVQDLNFSSRPTSYFTKDLFYGLEGITTAPYGDYWRQIRKIATAEFLSAKRIRSYHSLFEDEISNFMLDIRKSSSESKPLNLSGMVGTLMNSIMERCMFGDRRNLGNQKKLIPVIKEMTDMVARSNIVELFPSVKYLDFLVGTKRRAQRLHRRVDEILSNIMKDHELNSTTSTNPTGVEVECLVDALLRIRRQQENGIPLRDDSIKALIIDIISGGIDTTPVVVVWAMSQLMKNPQIMEKAQEEVRRVLKGKREIHERDFTSLSYMKLVIKETLRLHPPGPLFPKMCTDKCQVAGYDIQAGTSVIINAWAIGRDPRYWENPEEFKPERFVDNPINFKGTNFEYLPFGAGKRICPAILFSNTTMEFIMARLLLEFDWKLPNGMTPQELDLTESLGFANGRETDLYLLATPYSPTIGNN